MGAALELARLSDHDLDRVVETLREACLGSLIEPAVEWRGDRLVLLGYRLTRGIDPAPAKCQELRDSLARFLAPCTVEFAAAELARLSVSVVPRSREPETTANMRAAVFVEECIRYPADVVAYACRTWARESEWFPPLSSLVALMERRVDRRRRLDVICQEFIRRAPEVSSS